MIPLIGITSDVETVKDARGSQERRYFIKTALAYAVNKSGGEPLIIPFCGSRKRAGKIIERVDGLIVSGGNFDIDPSHYGQKRRKGLGTMERGRTVSEMLMVGAALASGKPVLGICGGQQLLNVFFGGTLYQDLRTERPGSLRHEQTEKVHKTSHIVRISKGSILYKISGAVRLSVNSTHHQAIKEIGKGLVCSAVAEDGVVEAVESTNDGKYVVGVQWHPEFLTGRKAHLAIFKSVVRAAARKR